ncbi:hypothetical protein [Komagataeibacter swingsii]|uniref:hypothetical protein n=1 Tax=Komagataeibacter swingsii TaxID=215220 RepID=UPI0011B6C708|nr:hypothetical protein [Komagataeibacter swingsii]
MPCRLFETPSHDSALKLKEVFGEAFFQKASENAAMLARDAWYPSANRAFFLFLGKGAASNIIA